MNEYDVAVKADESKVKLDKSMLVFGASMLLAAGAVLGKWLKF